MTSAVAAAAAAPFNHVLCSDLDFTVAVQYGSRTWMLMVRYVSCVGGCTITIVDADQWNPHPERYDFAVVRDELTQLASSTEVHQRIVARPIGQSTTPHGHTLTMIINHMDLPQWGNPELMIMLLSDAQGERAAELLVNRAYFRALGRRAAV